mgnify:CR=1 FL=1
MLQPIFFTAQQSNFVGKLEMNSGKVTVAKLRIDDARPYGILVDAQGFPWFNQFGTNHIGRMEPNSLEIKSYKLPNEKARDRRIARTPDGMIWYSDYARGYLGRLDPKDGDVKEWLELIQSASHMLLDLTENEEDVMLIFKKNKALFDVVKATDPDFFKQMMGKFTERKTMFTK